MNIISTKLKLFIFVCITIISGFLFSFQAKADNSKTDSADVNLEIFNPSDIPPPDKIPSYLVIVSGNNQTSSTRNINPLVVRIFDQNNNPLPGVKIDFSYSEYPAGAIGYSLNSASGISDSNGLVSIDAILGDKSGNYTIMARTGTLVVYFSEKYSPTTIPPVIPPVVNPDLVATHLIIVSGNNQVSSKQDLDLPLIVKVLDQNNNPLTNVQIDFFFSEYPAGATGYSTNPTSKLSDASGQVQVLAFLGDKTGTYKITAKTGSLTAVFSEIYQSTLGSRIAESIDNTAKSITSITNPVANSQIAKIMNKPIAYSAIIWAILSPLLANAPLALPWLTYFINWLAGFFNVGQKRKRWGTVYDSVSRKPISGVDVSIFNTRYNQLVETQTTDSKGRFVINAKPGVYYVMASREGFTFPSEYDLTGYRGKTISIGSGDSLVKIDIPIDPVGKSTFKRRFSWQSFSHVLDSVYYPFMILGTLFSVAIALNRYDITNFLILGLYEILWVSEFIKLVKNKTFGTIYDQTTRKPIDYAIVRLFNADNRKLLFTKISSSEGRYSILLSPGHYILVSAKEGYQTETHELRTRKESYLDENIFMHNPVQSKAGSQ